MLWDKGSWEPEVPDVDAALEKGDLKFALKGTKLKGSWVLVRTRGFASRRSTGSAVQASRWWLLIKHRDEWAGDVDVTERFDRSVTSFGDFAEILAQEEPEVWESHKPAEGGAAGKMLAEIIERAAQIKAAQASADRRGQAGATVKRARMAMFAARCWDRRNAGPGASSGWDRCKSGVWIVRGPRRGRPGRGFDHRGRR